MRLSAGTLPGRVNDEINTGNERNMLALQFQDHLRPWGLTISYHQETKYIWPSPRYVSVIIYSFDRFSPHI